MRLAAIAGGLAAALLALAGTAGATIPQGNLLANGDGEQGTAATDASTHVCPQSWICNGNMTLVRYGSPGFPSAAEGARIGGGNNFFAGGPLSDASGATQNMELTTAQGEIGAGQVKATFGACLGGWAAENDSMTLYLHFFTASGTQSWPATGPDAAARGNETKLLPVSRTVAVPANAQRVQFQLVAKRMNFNYNDGYADNVSFVLSPLADPAPPASPCSVPGAGGDGGGGSGGGSDGGSGQTGSADVLSFGKVRVKAGKARVAVRCNTRQGERCKGTLSASLTKGSASAAKAKLGSARFSIASTKRRTVKIPLRKSDAKTIKRLPTSQLAKRRVKLKARMTLGAASLKQTALVAVKRGG